MKITRQEMRCAGTLHRSLASPACQSAVVVELQGTHEARSTGLVLEQVAHDAGWNHETHQCPECCNRGDRPARPTR